MRKRNFENYCNEIENVENYELAKADNFKGWVCHHRLELIATGGVCDVTQQDLIDWGIYYNRPADELIFLTRKQHASLHFKGNQYGKGKHHSEEAKAKISEALKGNKRGLLLKSIRINCLKLIKERRCQKKQNKRFLKQIKEENFLKKPRIEYLKE